jgi:hypothetical protein
MATYSINTTGEELQNNYRNVSGGWELTGSGPSGPREYVETWECETDAPDALERLLDTDAAVLNYIKIGE